MLVGRAKIARFDALYKMDDAEIIAILDDLNEQEKTKIQSVRMMCYFSVKPWLKENITFDEFWSNDSTTAITPEQLNASEQLAIKAAEILSHGR